MWLDCCKYYYCCFCCFVTETKRQVHSSYNENACAPIIAQIYYLLVDFILSTLASFTFLLFSTVDFHIACYSMMDYSYR